MVPALAPLPAPSPAGHPAPERRRAAQDGGLAGHDGHDGHWRLGTAAGLPRARWCPGPAPAGTAARLARAYAAAGCLVLAGLLPARTARALARLQTALLAQHAPGRTVLVGLSVVSPRFRALHAHPRLLAALRPLLPRGIAFWSDKGVDKRAAAFATPLHIDAVYWAGEPAKLSVWIALDAATRANGCLTVVPGSHQHAWAHTAHDGAATNFEFARVLAAPARCAARAQPVVLAAGDAVLFGDRLVHGSLPQTAGQPRAAAILTYHTPGAPTAMDAAFPARRTLVPRGRAPYRPARRSTRTCA